MEQNNQTVEQSPVNAVARVADKVRKASNILVALSKNPTVDELSAALALALFLDKIGKHATGIFSGRMPNVLKFLKPEETFEANTDSLQDFIIALNKEKADHLRYKIDGDFVKVFITPYKTSITEKDLGFSHGDYNVDLVIALDVAVPADLDEALFEHGRILHDAGTVNITVNDPGKFGEVGWSDKKSSSVSEMVFMLIQEIEDGWKTVDQPVAMALMTGIVAATDRFSNEKTTPNALVIAGKLTAKGADPALIASHIIPEALEEEDLIGAAPVDFDLSQEAKEVRKEVGSGEAKDVDLMEAKDVPESSSVVAPEEPVPVPEVTSADSLGDNADSSQDEMPVFRIHKEEPKVEEAVGVEPSIEVGNSGAGSESAPEDVPAVAEDVAVPATESMAVPEAEEVDALPVPDFSTPPDVAEAMIPSLTAPEPFAAEPVVPEAPTVEPVVSPVVEEVVAPVAVSVPEVEPVAPAVASLAPVEQTFQEAVPAIASVPEVNGVPEIEYSPEIEEPSVIAPPVVGEGGFAPTVDQPVLDVAEAMDGTGGADDKDETGVVPMAGEHVVVPSSDIDIKSAIDDSVAKALAEVESAKEEPKIVSGNESGAVETKPVEDKNVFKIPGM